MVLHEMNGNPVPFTIHVANPHTDISIRIADNLAPVVGATHKSSERAAHAPVAAGM